MNILTNPNYGQFVNSEIFGCSFFLIPSFNPKYGQIEYGFYSAPTFADGNVDWDRQVSIAEWDIDGFTKEQHKELTDCWKTLMNEVIK